MHKLLMKIVITVLVLSLITPSFTEASTTLNTSEELAFGQTNELDKELKKTIEFTEEVINNENIIITTIQTDELRAISELAIDLESSEMIIDNHLEDQNGNVITNQFEVHLLHIAGENFKAILVDQSTGEEVYIDTEEVHASVAPLVIVLATVARYGITRAIAKHGAIQYGKALASNAAKTKLTTDSAATALARELGYVGTSYVSKAGTKIYKKSAKDAVDGPTYITRDRTSHVGGVWKGANKKPENVNSDTTRSGTYNAVLKRIGD